MEGTIAQHPPAMKVGGRRLSMSIKHKPTISAEAAVITPETEDRKETTAPDYPRPTPRTVADEAAQQQVHTNEEELPPRKEKKCNHDKDNRFPHRKTETTRPTRDVQEGNKSQRMGLRIGQPAGKGFGA